MFLIPSVDLNYYHFLTWETSLSVSVNPYFTVVFWRIVFFGCRIVEWSFFLSALWSAIPLPPRLHHILRNDCFHRCFSVNVHHSSVAAFKTCFVSLHFSSYIMTLLGAFFFAFVELLQYVEYRFSTNLTSFRWLLLHVFFPFLLLFPQWLSLQKCWDTWHCPTVPEVLFFILMSSSFLNG